MPIQEIQEIRVGLKEGGAEGEKLKTQFAELGIPDAQDVRAATVFRFEGITPEEAELLAREALTDPIMQRAVVNGELFEGDTKKLEIGDQLRYINPISATLQRAADILGIHPLAASISREYYIRGDVSDEQLVAAGNKLAKRVEEIIYEKPETLIISGIPAPVETIPITGLSNKELSKLCEKWRIFLNIEEMNVIQGFYRNIGREPTDVELKMIDQTWSEHSGHKTFKGKLIDEQGNEKEPLIKRIRRTAEKYFERVGVVTAFKDNAGGIRFYDGQAIIAKGETHNSPVAVEPFGGAMTKNGGVYRDIAGCGDGGETLIAIMVNCMGMPDTKPEDVVLGALHPKYLLKENFRGEREYGNPMGIPTHATTLHFHPDFGPKPTSMGIVVGIIPEDKCEKADPQVGDILVTIGGKTGRDGINGASFSSGEMDATTSTVDAGAVQIGNPIEEKRVFDALIACRDAGVISAQTDVGGGGYSAAIGELGENTGVRVHLDRVQLKFQGLAPWEIWLSESQERMVVAVHPDNLAEFMRICASCEAPADVLGEFTGDHQVTLLYNDEIVGQLPMDFLHHGLPQRRLNMEHIPYPENNDVPVMPRTPEEWVNAYKQVLGNLNVASTEVMLRQFDTTVQGRTVLHPFTGVHQDAPNDASVVAPIYGKPYGLVTSHALNPILNRYDPYKGTLWAVAMAASKLTAVGGNINEAAMIDNFVWPKPNPKFLGDLDSSVNGLCDMMDCLQIPCVSGKDSLSSTFVDKVRNVVVNIPPVLNMTIFGKIPDVKKTVTLDIKKPGSTLVLVGKADVENLGGSIYFQTQGIENTHVPEVNTNQLMPVLNNIRIAIQGRTPKNEGPVTRFTKNLLDNIRTAIQGNNVLSCKAVGEGGLATMLAQMCFGGDCGAKIDIQAVEAARPDFGFYNQTAGTFIVEVANEQIAQKLFKNVPHVILGKTTKEKSIQVRNGETSLFKADLYELKQAWQEPMGKALS